MTGPLDVRRAGVLLHVTSLPPTGPETPGDAPATGTFADAPAFVDFLADTGCTVWQVLPLVPTHRLERSPYDATSTMAISPELIGPEPEEGAGPRDAELLQPEEWARVNADWLDPYAEFTVLRALHDDNPWLTWPAPLRDREPGAVAEALADHTDALARVRHEQLTAARQWAQVKAQANRRGVLILGDLPIFVSLDSADVWAHRDQFLLGPDGRPTTVTGVPPDYFAADGQKWNNPHYDWDRMAADEFAWWRRRIARQRDLFDLVRIDHFRGFEAAWHVPADAVTAREGEWVPGPGRAVLDALVAEAGPGTLVAEDLGVITPAVAALRDAYGLPGMKVLQFGFDGNADNWHHPVNHGENAVVYTGTHDNDTALGWWETLDETVRARVREAMSAAGVGDHPPMPWGLVRLALSSTARLAVVPAQDLLDLGSSARMNTPGVRLGNWGWRAPTDAFADDLLRVRLRDAVVSTERHRGTQG